MKKILLLLLMVVFLSSLMAQETNTESNNGKIYIGAKVGYGIVDFESINTSVKDFAKMTYDNISYGIVAGYRLTGRLSIQLEGNYAQYSAHNIIPTYVYSPESPLLQPYSDNSTVDHVDMALYNADIPLTVHYSLSEGGISPYVYCGVNWGINIIGNTTIVRAITSSEVVYREYNNDITARINYYEFAPVIGGGIKINMGSLSIIGDIRYKYGFQNLSNVNNGFGFTNSALWISGGIILNL